MPLIFFFFTVGMHLPEISVTSYNAKCFFSQTMIFDLSQLTSDIYIFDILNVKNKTGKVSLKLLPLILITALH